MEHLFSLCYMILRSLAPPDTLTTTVLNQYKRIRKSSQTEWDLHILCFLKSNYEGHKTQIVNYQAYNHLPYILEQQMWQVRNAYQLTLRLSPQCNTWSFNRECWGKCKNNHFFKCPQVPMKIHLVIPKIDDSGTLVFTAQQRSKAGEAKSNTITCIRIHIVIKFSTFI